MFNALYISDGMISLEKTSGLPIKLHNNSLIFEAITQVEPDIRALPQMKPVLLDKEVVEPKECYYMYRDICFEKDREKIKRNNLRFDITVIPPIVLGEEYNKTAGHFHPVVPNTGLTYPEVYEVLNGKAHYLLQKKDEEDIMLIEARAGEKVIVPPNYGHVTINPSSSCLVMANWVERNFKSEYEQIREKQGAMYYETEEGWVKNENYTHTPPMREHSPRDVADFGLVKGKPMYELVNEIEKLDFLKIPQNYLKILDKLLE